MSEAEQNPFLTHYAKEGGHDIDFKRFECRTCGCPMIDLDEDRVYGDMRKCSYKQGEK